MTNVQTMPDGKHIVDTGLPQKFIKNIWLEMHKEINLKIIDAISMNQTTNGILTTKRMMQFSISLILDEDVRAAIKQKRDKLLAEKLKGDQGNDEKARATEEVYFELMEDVTDYIDQAFGVSHRIAIGID